MAPSRKPAGGVRPACDSDIALIEAWLPQDDEVASLAVNWDQTKEVYAEKGMLVWEDPNTHEPLAYFWGSLHSTSSILEVAPGRRGQGIGRALVEYLVAKEKANGVALLEVECAPPSSETFWRRMGFDTRWDGRHLIGRRVLRITQVLPDGPRLPVTVAFFPEEAIYDRQRCIPALAEYMLTGVKDTAGDIWLSEKVACFDLADGKNLVIRIEVAGSEIYFDKAKYSKGEHCGVTRCDNGFAVSRIKLCTDI